MPQKTTYERLIIMCPETHVQKWALCVYASYITKWKGMKWNKWKQNGPLDSSLDSSWIIYIYTIEAYIITWNLGGLFDIHQISKSTWREAEPKARNQTTPTWSTQRIYETNRSAPISVTRFALFKCSNLKQI